MGTRLTFSFYGEAQIDRTLGAIEARATDARPVWDALADRFLSDERRQFESEGAYGSGRWAPLSPKYAAWKAIHFPGKGILQRTGELAASLTDGPQVRMIRPQEMVIGSGVAHGGYHQRGDGVPRRRPVELPESERAFWVKAVQRFIVKGEV